MKRSDSLYFIQGLLQHYGWRSFFVDLSSDARVAAWFASHSFQSNRQFQLCENASEAAVMLTVLGASYSDHLGVGNLYVLSKALLKESKHALISLEDDLTTDCPSRFKNQKAWLAGVFHDQKRLDPQAVVAHITAPAAVFAELAQSAGLKETNDVFPDPKLDKLLANLLDLPWLRVEIPDSPFPIYSRSLEIPEYQVSFTKHLPETTALYTPFWLSEVKPPDVNEIRFHLPEEAFYGEVDIRTPIPRLSEFLRRHNVVHIESNNILCYPAQQNSVSYEKGVFIERKDNDLFIICSIYVDHCSDKNTGFGVSEGYLYELEGSRLLRRPSSTDCPCGDPVRHEQHLIPVVILDHLLSECKVKRHGQIITVSF